VAWLTLLGKLKKNTNTNCAIKCLRIWIGLEEELVSSWVRVRVCVSGPG